MTRVRLRPVKPADLPVHFEHQREPESIAMAAVAGRDRAAFDEHWARTSADPSVVLRSIVVGDEVVGLALSFVRDGERHVGYRVGRDHWGRGIASAALGQLLEVLPERPLVATVAEHNGASLRVLEKHGFERVRREPADDGVTVWVLRLG